VNYYGQQVEIDSQGRLLLPQILRTKASLDAEVTVIGMRTYVEVHNREKFEQDLPPEGLTDEHQQAIDEILSGRMTTKPPGGRMTKRLNGMRVFFSRSD